MSDCDLMFSQYEVLKQENERLKDGLTAIKKQLDGFELMTEGLPDQCSCSIFLLKNLRGILARSETDNTRSDSVSTDDMLHGNGEENTGSDGQAYAQVKDEGEEGGGDNSSSSGLKSSNRKRPNATSPEVSEASRKRFTLEEGLGNSGSNNNNNTSNTNGNNSSPADLLMSHNNLLAMDPFCTDSTQRSGNNSQELKQFRIQQCLQSFSHAAQCQSCNLPSCHKMKLVITHVKNCQRKTQFGCQICKNLVTLCCYHARSCEQSNCLLPFCATIKEKLRLKKQQHARQQLLQRMQMVLQMNSQSQQDSYLASANSTFPPESEIDTSPEHQDIPPPNLSDADANQQMSDLMGPDATESSPAVEPTVKVEFYETPDQTDPLAYDSTYYY